MGFFFSCEATRQIKHLDLTRRLFLQVRPVSDIVVLLVAAGCAALLSLLLEWWGEG